MGFERPGKLYRLTWEDGHDLAGLEVVMRPLSIDGWLRQTELVLEMVRLSAAAEQAATAGDVKERVANIRELLTVFAEALESWNLTAGGEPVPATLEAVLAQEKDFILEISRHWRQGLSQAPPPLPGPSSDGESTELEASLPMAPLSSSPSS